MGGKWSKRMGGWPAVRERMRRAEPRAEQQQMGWEQYLETWETVEQSQVAIQQLVMLILPG
uniref:Truncated nef protein n=1 Tax=Human immunodeficiency virus type 1 TaxID=11676 RepID=H9TQ45_HV1|nr:truncated nef protein [Human immunodeficiency virus 1]